MKLCAHYSHASLSLQLFVSRCGWLSVHQVLSQGLLTICPYFRFFRKLSTNIIWEKLMGHSDRRRKGWQRPDGSVSNRHCRYFMVVQSTHLPYPMWASDTRHSLTTKKLLNIDRLAVCKQLNSCPSLPITWLLFRSFACPWYTTLNGKTWSTWTLIALLFYMGISELLSVIM